MKLLDKVKFILLEHLFLTVSHEKVPFRNEIRIRVRLSIGDTEIASDYTDIDLIEFE